MWSIPPDRASSCACSSSMKEMPVLCMWGQPLLSHFTSPVIELSKSQVMRAPPKSNTRYGRRKSCDGALSSALGGSVQLSSRAEGMAHHVWLVLREENLQLIAARPSWPPLQASCCDGARKAKPNLPSPGCVRGHGLAQSAPISGFLWAGIC